MEIYYSNSGSGGAGPQGPAGPPGNDGAQGTQGAEGAQGIQGLIGTEGVQGASGSAGSSGEPGVQGTTGADGAQGIQGFEGVAGAKGDEGLQGITGADGAQGTQGTQGTTGAQGAGGTKGWYGSFYDTTTHTATSTNTAYAITLNSTDLSNGISINPTYKSRIVFANTGTYDIQFSAQITTSNASLQNIQIWIAKNGTYLSWTNSQVTLAGNGASAIPAWNFVLDLAANDYIEFFWATSDTSAIISSGTTPLDSAPNSPSIIITATQVAYSIQGIQGTQGVQGYGYSQSQGTQGTQGTQGVQGTQGIQGFDGVQGIQGFDGATGPAGADGSGVTILGTYPTIEDVQTAHPTGNIGDAYLLTDGNLVVWTGSSWQDVGNIQGPQGVQGATGPQGTAGSEGAQGTTGLTGDPGSTGVQGTQGIQGTQGTQGTQGFEGTQGTQGFGYAQLQGVQGVQGLQGTLGNQGITGTTGSLTGYYAFINDTTTQTASAANTAYAVALGNLNSSSGITVSNTSRINFANAGTYQIVANMQFDNSDSGPDQALTWLKKNGTNLANSTYFASVVQKRGSTNGVTLITWVQVVTVAANDYVEIYWQTDSTTVRLLTTAAAGNYPQAPAVNLVVRQLA